MRLVVIVESRDNDTERHILNTRIVFDREFTHAVRRRGQTMGELAKRARFSLEHLDGARDLGQGLAASVPLVHPPLSG